MSTAVSATHLSTGFRLTHQAVHTLRRLRSHPNGNTSIKASQTKHLNPRVGKVALSLCPSLLFVCFVA